MAVERPLGAQGRAVQRFLVTAGQLVAWWTRLECEAPDALPAPPPALVVVNHGFGGLADPNALVLAALLDRMLPQPEVPITVLTHQLAWTAGVGRLLEPAGFRPASRAAAMDGLAGGGYVVVMPGGDLDAGKSFAHRNEIVFGGRTGFAAIAIEAGVPVVPIVVSGAGETVFVLSDGRWLAERLRLPRLVRMKTLPVSVSVPYGLSIGVAGMLPYVPLPAKMRAAVLEPIAPADGETPAALAGRVEAAMSAALTGLTAGRVPFLGTPRPGTRHP